MGTRGFIGRVALDVSETVRGSYHHWDSYPSGLGVTLFEVIRGYFKGDIEAALVYLINDHPGGWSTINGKDLSLPPGFTDHNEQACTTCGRKNWEHYKQEYAPRKKRLPAGASKVEGYVLFGHSPTHDESLQPECYCHGGRSEPAWNLTLSTAAGSGCEYAYVISPETRTMYVLSSYSDDGTKMIGMFGMGDEDATWKELARVDLDGPEPDWKKMQGFA